MSEDILQNATGHAGSAAFDLGEELETLRRDTPSGSGDGRRVLMASPDFQIVLRTLPANSRIADHHDHGRISVQTVRGRLRMVAGGRDYDLKPGSVAVVDHGVTHSIEVLEDSAFLLTASMHAQVRRGGGMPDLPDGRATEAFRQEHVELKEHLSHLSRMIESVATTSSERQENMERLVGALRSHILVHAEWEERVLYPVIDAKAAAGPVPFTATMRHEHRIVSRWIDDLDRQSKSVNPDAVTFARAADQLLGLILAHFEDEEEVLLPIVDATMTREEFEREILAKGTPHQKL